MVCLRFQSGKSEETIQSWGRVEGAVTSVRKVVYPQKTLGKSEFAAVCVAEYTIEVLDTYHGYHAFLDAFGYTTIIFTSQPSWLTHVNPKLFDVFHDKLMVVDGEPYLLAC